MGSHGVKNATGVLLGANPTFRVAYSKKFQPYRFLRSTVLRVGLPKSIGSLIFPNPLKSSLISQVFWLDNERKRRYSFVSQFLTKRWFCDGDTNQTQQPPPNLRPQDPQG